MTGVSDLTEAECEVLLRNWGNFADDFLEVVAGIVADRVAQVGTRFAEWSAKNEVAGPPLDWAGFGEIVRWTGSPLAYGCWCGSPVGPRAPGDQNGFGCLADITHNWRG